MNHIPVSKETEIRLIKSLESSIGYVSKSIDETRNLISKINLIEKFLKENELNSGNETFVGLKKMLEYRMLLGIIILDLASATRAHFNSKYTYEKLFSIRQIIVIINEGYKQIYNFVYLNEQGNMITKQRNKSFWFKDIGEIIIKSLPELSYEYNILTEKLETYFIDNFSSIKEKRDLSVHYDKEASKVYDMTFNLDVDENFRKMSPFLWILTEMFGFVEKMAFITQVTEERKTNEQYNHIESMIREVENKLANVKTEKNIDEIKELLEMINKTKNDLLNKIKSPNR
jgi:hypothetical protein